MRKEDVLEEGAKLLDNQVDSVLKRFTAWTAGDRHNNDNDLVIELQQETEKSSFVNDIIMGKKYKTFEVTMNRIGAKLSDFLAANEVDVLESMESRAGLRIQFIAEAMEELRNSTRAMYDEQGITSFRNFGDVNHNELILRFNVVNRLHHSGSDTLLNKALNDIDNKYKGQLEAYFGRMFDLACNLRTSQDVKDKTKQDELDSLIQGKKMWDMILSYAGQALAAGMIILAAAIGFTHKEMGLDLEPAGAVIVATYIVFAAVIVLDFGSVLLPAQNKNQYGEKMLALLDELDKADSNGKGVCIEELNKLVGQIHKEAKDNLKALEKALEKEQDRGLLS